MILYNCLSTRMTFVIIATVVGYRSVKCDTVSIGLVTAGPGRQIDHELGRAMLALRRGRSHLHHLDQQGKGHVLWRQQEGYKVSIVKNRFGLVKSMQVSPDDIVRLPKAIIRCDLCQRSKGLYELCTFYFAFYIITATGWVNWSQFW